MQSKWENVVEYNLSESGVHPMQLGELLALNGTTVADLAQGGSPDPLATLQTLQGALRGYLEDRVRNDLTPVVHERIGDRDDLRTFYDEVCLPTLDLTTDVVFEQVNRWASGEVDSRALQEALSAILLSLTGRSAVVATDVLLAETQGRIQDLLEDVAPRAGDLAAELGASNDMAEIIDHSVGWNQNIA